MERNEIIQKIWRGNDPFKEFPAESQKSDLQGWNSVHPYLLEAIDELKPRVVAEVGVWKGGSVVSMATHLKENGIQGTILAIDTWLGSWDHWESEWFDHLNVENGYPTIFSTFMNNIISKEIVDFVVPLPLDSVNASHVIRHYGIRPSVIHLDGGHDYRAVTADLEAWWPLLANGGILIGDDYFPEVGWPEVKLAFDHFVARQNIGALEHYQGKCRLRKILQ